MATGEVLVRLDVDPDQGLSPDEARARAAIYGPNRLAEEARRGALMRFLDQFRNFLILILLAAAAVSFVVAESPTTPLVILGVVLVNAVLGFVQENKAERSLEALKKMLVVRARARRGGTVVELPADDLVPGDIVLLEAGERVPADGRLLVAVSLEIEEAALTGESQPVTKSPAELAVLDVPLGDRSNLAYMNTTVTRGRGEMVVTATGMQTQIGTIAGLLRSTIPERTPLQKQLDHVAHTLAALAGVVVLLVGVIGMLRGQTFHDLFLTAVALAVASVPEGLPAVLAVTLAVGAYRMAQRNAIVKQLASVETLGATTIICSDKTGTLTLNEMTVRSLHLEGRDVEVTGEGYHPIGELSASDGGPMPAVADLLVPFVLCSDASVRHGEVVGDPTEGALVVAAAKAGIDFDTARKASPRVAEIPFDSAAKYMATLHEARVGGRRCIRMYVKGAPDVLFARAAHPSEDLAAANLALAQRGLRVLAVGYRDLDPEAVDLDGDLGPLVRDLTILGLAGILDPPRPEARDAIALCRKAGIRVKMITGDHAATADAIARALGIEGSTVTGTDLDHMSDEELEDRINSIGVFARVAPEHKLKLVRVLQRKGNVVAMTGDGVNDAPALRQADIGVAMGITGTEVTKEAATMVLADDNFATIVEAVKRGRTIYDNIVKFVRFQLSTTAGFGITFLTATATGIAAGKPFTALQILWVNIIMDGPPAMALGVDPPAPDVMVRRPRPLAEKLLMPRRLVRLIFFATVMATGTLAVLLTAPDYVGNTRLEGTVAMTMAFTTFVFFQFFNVLNARNEYLSALGRHSLVNWKLWATIGVVIVLHAAAVHLGPLQEVFDTTSLSAAQWATCIAVASSILWLEEARKLAVRVVLRAR
jgi:Ca2+-transporting ATPase